MDQCTHEVRLQYWKNIISQCQARPDGQSAKQWMKENGICEQSYYLWQRRIRRETYAQMEQTEILSSLPEQHPNVSFAEISIKNTETASITQPSVSSPIHPIAVLKTERYSIALANDIPETLLSLILKEVSHA